MFFAALPNTMVNSPYLKLSVSAIIHDAEMSVHICEERMLEIWIKLIIT